jgi:hypothetical protein
VGVIAVDDQDDVDQPLRGDEGNTRERRCKQIGD